MILMAFFQQGVAGEISVAWDPVTDSLLGGYELQYGLSSADYDTNVDVGNVTAFTVTGLDAGSTYSFRVRAYSQDRSLWSAFSNEVSRTVNSQNLDADFSASTTSGASPLTVTFSDASTGAIDSYEWDFGDGSMSTSSTAIHTYTSAGTYTVSLTVTGPGGSATETKTDLVNVTPVAPEADFAVSQTTGVAPLTVAFSDASSGDIADYYWDFGDGDTSSATDPTHTYLAPGDYEATLTVTGPGGSNTKTDHIQVLASDDGSSEIEAGEIALDNEWVRVDFRRPFNDPVVIVKPLSSNGGAPAVVRVDSVDGTGFLARVQEWDYLDGSHTTETASYMVIESGTHQLPNGTWVEGGHVDTKDGDFLSVDFAAPFTTVPVVLTTVTTFNEEDAVTTRLRGIDRRRFRVKLQEQEASSQQHAFEVVDYIAWEPSEGEFEGLRFEVGRTADEVTHKAHTIGISTTFDEPPLLLADMQSTDGGDTANLRWNPKGSTSVDVWVDEEQSRDSETRHTTETVAYAAFALTTAQPESPVAGLVAAYSFDDASGTDALDTSGNGNDGVVLGAYRIKGKFGNALAFDGLDNWVTIGDNASLDLTDEMTLEAWVYPTRPMTGWQTVLLKESAGGLAYGLYANSDANQPVASVHIDGDRNLYGGSALPPNAWTHLAATYDGITQRLYINGAEIASEPLSGNLQISDGALRIGGNNSWLGEFFEGYIDEVRVYNKVLDATEIQADIVAPVTQ